VNGGLLLKPLNLKPVVVRINEKVINEVLSEEKEVKNELEILRRLLVVLIVDRDAGAYKLCSRELCALGDQWRSGIRFLNKCI